MGVLTVDPFTNPDAFNLLNVGGTDNPGVFSLEAGCGNRPYKWDVKPVAGGQGATTTYQGFDVAKIKGKFKLWTSAQIAEFFAEYLPLLSYDATKTKPTPITIFHPSLFANDITSVVVQDIGPLTHEGGQLWTVTIEMLEFRPAPKQNTTTTPKSANPATKNAAGKPTVTDALDQAIEREMAIARKPLP